MERGCSEAGNRKFISVITNEAIRDMSRRFGRSFRAEPLHRLGGDCPHDPSTGEVANYNLD
jgi:hypothetical protein